MTNDVTTVGNVSEENKLAMTSTLGGRSFVAVSRESVSRRNVASLIEHRGERTNEREGTKGKRKTKGEIRRRGVFVKFVNPIDPAALCGGLWN